MTASRVERRAAIKPNLHVWFALFTVSALADAFIHRFTVEKLAGVHCLTARHRLLKTEIKHLQPESPYLYEFKVLHIVLMAKFLLVEKYDNARGIIALPSSSVCIKTHVKSYTWLA